MSCPDCIKGAILPGEPKGTMNNDGSYLVSSPENPSSKRAIVLLTSAFGLSLNNPKIIADHMSSHLQCDVWVPDIFAGKPLLREGQLKLPERANQKIGIGGWIKFYLTILRSTPKLIANRPSVVDKRIMKFLNKIKAEKQYDHIGAVGYCFGGTAAVRLGVTDAVDCIVVCHPGNFPLKCVEQLKVPVAWVCAEDDFSFSKAKRKKTEEILAGRVKEKDSLALDYEFKDYPGTVHGFAIRPNTQLPEIKEAFWKSQEQTISWFEKHL